MATEFAIRCNALLANGELVRPQMRFRWEDVIGPSAAELENAVDAAMTEFNTHRTLWAADMGFGGWEAYTYERIVPAGWNPAAPVAPFPHFSPTSAYIGTTVGSGPGLALGQSLPPQNAHVVSFRTAAPGRKAQGRIYTYPPPETLVDAAGTVSDAALRVTAFREIAEAVEASNIPKAIEHIVHSLWYGDVNDVINYTGNSRIDTQRRRLL